MKQLDDENAKLKKLLAEQMLDVAALRELLAKNVWSAPSVQGFATSRWRFQLHMYGPPRPCKGSRHRDGDSSCINVSGLSRVGCCCSQAMMRSAHAVPNKWFGREARFFAQGLRRADPLFRHHYSRALQSNREVRRMQDPCVRRALPAWSGQPRQYVPSWQRVRQQPCSDAFGSAAHRASSQGDPGFDPDV